jgi:hypothetical protein
MSPSSLKFLCRTSLSLVFGTSHTGFNLIQLAYQTSRAIDHLACISIRGQLYTHSVFELSLIEPFSLVEACLDPF